MADLKHFFERGSCRGPIASSELIAFKRACTDEEYNAYVEAAKAENAKFAAIA
jgi:hypothetical protein